MILRHPNTLYPFKILDACVKFLRSQADGLGLPIRVIEVVEGKPIVIISWVGTEPNLPSILLNSHMDVVPVYEVNINLLECKFLKIILTYNSTKLVH